MEITTKLQTELAAMCDEIESETGRDYSHLIPLMLEANQEWLTKLKTEFSREIYENGNSLIKIDLETLQILILSVEREIMQITQENFERRQKLRPE